MNRIPIRDVRAQGKRVGGKSTFLTSL